jgi:hypothetical protein
MKVEVIERKRIFKGKQENFWEVRVDGKIIEVTEFDPTSEIEKMCEELKKEHGCTFKREDENLINS